MKNWKKIVSVVCILALVVTAISFSPMKKAKADGIDTDIEESPEGLTPITWENFGLGYQTFTSATSESERYKSSNLTSLMDTSFRGMVTFTKKNAASGDFFICYAAKGTEWGGFRITPQNDGTLKFAPTVITGDPVILNPKEAGLDSFLNTEFELGIDLWKVNGTTAKYNIFINGKQYNETAYSFTYNSGDTRNNVNFIISKEGDSITVGQEKPIAAKPENLRELKLTEFGIMDGVYTATAFKGYAGTSTEGSILNTTFRQKMEFHREMDGDYYICYGAKGIAWNGIRIVPDKDGNLKLQCFSDSGSSFVLEPDKAGLESFLDVEFELGIDLWESYDDALFDVYINGTKYNETPYTWVNAVKENAIGNNINLIIPSAENFFRFGTLIVENPEKLPSDFKVIGFHDFEIGSGTYGFAKNDLAVKGSYKGSMDRTIFDGDVTFNNPGGYMTYAGKQSAWHGFCFEPQANGNLRLYETSGVMPRIELSPVIAGTTLVGQKFNLKISILFMDNDEDGNKNDVQLGIWINDVLYNNSYIILPDYMEKLGGNLGIYCKTEDTSVTIQARKVDYGEAIMPESSLKEISFSSFGIKDGIYGYKKNDLAVTGGYYDVMKGTILDGTLFNADVKFSSYKMMLRYGGKKSAWEGLWFESDGDIIKLWDGKNLVCKFLPEIAGTQLVDNTFNLKLSIVYVDSDSDGVKDDVQLGVWFNDVMYRNRYIYITDFAPQMGSLLGIYSSKEGETLEVRSAEVYNGIDYGIFGFDKNYESYLKTTGIERIVYTNLKEIGKVKNPTTGESNLYIWFWLFTIAASFTGIAVGVRRLKKHG